MERDACIYIYIYIHLCIYVLLIYIYTYIERYSSVESSPARCSTFGPGLISWLLVYD